MERVIIIIVCSLGVCSGDITTYLNLNGPEQQIAETYVQECYNSSKIDDSIYNRTVLCKDMSDTRIQEFLYCYFKKYNFMTEDNKFNTAIIRPSMSSSNYKLAVRCTRSARSYRNVFQRAANFFECLITKFVPDVCTKRPRVFF